MTEAVRVYDASKDEVVPVTQEWCDDMTRATNALAAQRRLARWVLGFNIANDKDKLEQMTKLAFALGMRSVG